ncbi:NAD-dependent epimerase/dehydratase family protein [Paenibacillus sp. NPDC058071]|uniref:NAD-dependent epimerase/dehydratase family protein n=1 Tax=Paenibacillus sp. NPDC058071 TaxID=3346326 RepID=UPI0036DAB4F2
MNIFVAGASGVIGRSLLPRLIQAGHRVIGMTSQAKNIRMIEETGAQAVVADVFDREGIMTVLNDIRPDLVIHQLTSLSNGNTEENAKIRIEGTRNLVDAAKAAGVQKIIAQSIAWAYEPGNSPAAEDVPLDTGAASPRSVTIKGIVSLENAIAEIPQHVILRYGTFYGPGTWYDSEGMIAAKVKNGELPASDAVTSFIHVEDAVQAAIKALEWPNGAVNIVDDEPAAGKDWLLYYANKLQAPAPVYQEGRNSWERGASNAKARNIYGWEPNYPTWRLGFEHL